MTQPLAPSIYTGSSRFGIDNLSLPRKVALIPALTLLLMGLMLAVAVQMGERNTAALRTLDRDVFEPLNRAQMLKGGVAQVHTRLFALLSIGTNEVNQAAQKTNAAVLTARLDAEVENFARFLDSTTAVPQADAGRLRQEFAAYAALVRETVGFALYDTSYGALLAAVADDAFGHLRASLDTLVEVLALRRAALAQEAVGNSLDAEKLLIGLGLGAALLALLGSAMVGRGIARPVLGLTVLMDRLAAGDTDLVVPGTERSEEVGAMARAVEVFRTNVIARRRSEAALQRTNLQFDAALNSMLQGMVVWGSDNRVQLVNARYFAICRMPEGCVEAGMTVRQVNDAAIRHGLHAGEDPDEFCNKVNALLTARRSMQIEMAMRPDLIVRLASEPMENGGAVITFEDVTEKRQTEKQIVFMARHDALTSLPNRALFREHLDVAIVELGEGKNFAVLCLDLDHFKQVNDTLGHAAGDLLLQLVAERLRGSVRDDDLIARLGGDEFAIVLANKNASPADAAGVAARLVETIGAPYDLQGHTVVVGTSIGIVLSEPGVPMDELLKRADVALYHAKEQRNTFAFFEPGMDALMHTRRELEAELQVAVHRGDFELYYQPVYSLIEDRVTAFEALIRWNHHTRGRVAPDEFIPLAEQTGLIMPIGEWVLRTACTEAAAWPDNVTVAVNLSPVQFRSKRLVTAIGEILEQTGLPARRLVLEITETAMLQDTEAVIAMLRDLHDLGIMVSMDDFGTGYSSLSYLQRFPFDKIKIDRSFIGDIRVVPPDTEDTHATTGTPARAATHAVVILRAMIGLGHHLGISTIAEGVETAQQLAHIRQEGCPEVQGYYISPPRPAAEVAGLLHRLDATMPAIAAGRGALPRRIA